MVADGKTLQVQASCNHTSVQDAVSMRASCVSLCYDNDIGSIGSRGRTVGIPYVYPPP